MSSHAGQLLTTGIQYIENFVHSHLSLQQRCNLIEKMDIQYGGQITARGGGLWSPQPLPA